MYPPWGSQGAAARPSRPPTVQQPPAGRDYLHAADGSSFCTLADGVVGQMIRCTNNGGILLASLLQRSRSIFAGGSFLSFFAFKEGILDTQISALGGWPTVSGGLRETEERKQQ